MCNHLCKGKPSCGHQILQKGIKSSRSGELCHAVALFTDVMTGAGIVLYAITQRKKKEGKRERHMSNRGRLNEQIRILGKKQREWIQVSLNGCKLHDALSTLTNKCT